jgi:Nop14-like family
MHAPDDDSDNEEGSDDDGPDGNKTIQKKLKSSSGDDLGDSFILDNDEADKKGWADDILGNKSDGSDDGEEEGDDDGVDEDEEVEFGKNMLARDWEQSDEDEPITVPEESEGVDEKEKKSEFKAGKTTPRNDKGVIEGLPFVIEAPSNLKELSTLLDNRSEVYCTITIIIVIIVIIISILSSSLSSLLLSYCHYHYHLYLFIIIIIILFIYFLFLSSYSLLSLIFEIFNLMLSDSVSFLAYPNLFGVKGFVVVVVAAA